MYPEIKIFLSRPVIPKVICLILMALLIWQIISNVLSFFPSKSKKAYPTQKEEHPIPASTATLEKSLRTPFFGEYVPTNLNEANVKKSMLNLNVVGIIFANKENESQVIIRTANGEEHIYRVGDKLPGGVVIKRITPEGVLFIRGGALESLSLPKNELIFHQPSKPLFKD